MQINGNPHDWRMVQGEKPWMRLNGCDSALVKLTPDSRGLYLWTYKKVASFSASIDHAKEQVEALWELDTTPGFSYRSAI